MSISSDLPKKIAPLADSPKSANRWLSAGDGFEPKATLPLCQFIHAGFAFCCRGTLLGPVHANASPLSDEVVIQAGYGAGAGARSQLFVGLGWDYLNMQLLELFR